VKTVRGLHDEISKDLSDIGNHLDALVGRVDCQAEHRAFLRKLRSRVTNLSDLLSAEIPAADVTSRTIFSMEIRREISEVNQMLEAQKPLEDVLLQLKELLGFPKYFLEQSKGKLRTLVPLTKREKEVLALLPRGLTAKAMASELFLTEATIKTHLATIYRKFEVQNRSQAIAIGVENKLLTF
jgi:ATP/maltotriose-dependent transcriptional regulator MalT